MRFVQRSRRMVCFLLALTFFLLLMLSACGVHDSPESIVKECFAALQSGDLERGLACLTPTRQAEYQGWLALFGGLSGIDLNTVFGGLVGYASSSKFQNLEVKITGSNKTDSTHARISIDIYENRSLSGSTIIKCVKIDDKWYIDF